MIDVVHYAKKRYTTKVFDPSKKISNEQIQQLKSLAQYSASSVNSQPWHFVLAATDEGKQLIAQATEEFAFNTPKILNASHVLVLCRKTDITDEYLNQLLEQEQQDGRFSDEQGKQIVAGARAFFTGLHVNELHDAPAWMEKQVYLALGNLLLGASLLDIDSCPIEGFDAAKLNQVLGLTEQGYSATVVLALGYHAEDDFNAKLPKSRLTQEVIFSEI